MMYSHATFPFCRYYIIAHEIAHIKTPFHDEYHELLVLEMSSQFLQRLHGVEDVREYLGYAMEWSWR